MPRVAGATGRLTLPPAPFGARARALKTVERLRDVYPAACELDHSSPYQLVIATILSAQTTDRRVNEVTPRLFARWPEAIDLAGADPAEVEQLIKPTGFFRAKSRAIMACARYLVEHHRGQVPRRMVDLVKLPGVGRKTANVILGVGFGVPGFPVDTHVNRLTNRLRMVASTDPVKIEHLVCAVVPKREWTDLSLRLILHGRRVCVARKPRCGECVLNDFCPSSTLPVKARRAVAGRPEGAVAAAR